MRIFRLIVSTIALVAVPVAGLAGEWRAERLRGVVLMMVDGQWENIERGDVIDDSRVIRTGANGQVVFRSGEQVIELARNTQIQISAAEGRDHSWILHAGGALTADVDARDVEHFGVVTQHMIAVVKGTRFTVHAGEETASVEVERGSVAVSESDTGRSVTLSPGQSVTGGSGRMAISGAGELPPVLGADGRVIATPAAAAQRGENASRGGPRLGDDAPGNSGSAPGLSGDAPGNSANAPGRSGGAPGNSGNAPGLSGDAPGNSGNTPAQNASSPGNSGNTPAQTGNSGDSRGNADSAPGRSGGAPGKKP